MNSPSRRQNKILSPVLGSCLAVSLLALCSFQASSARANGALRPLFESRFVAVETSGSPIRFAVADFNGDEIFDIAATLIGWPTGKIAFIPGRRDGTFGDAVDIAAKDGYWEGIEAADLNGDGRMDLAVLHYDGTVDILLGTGDGSFDSPVSYSYPMYSRPAFVLAADLNQDGVLDLAVTSFGESVHVMTGLGDGSFGPGYAVATGPGACGLAVGDFDRNGVPDLAVASYRTRGVSVLLGTGNGEFRSAMSLTAGYGPYAIAVGDLNTDGRDDIVVSNGGLSCGWGTTTLDSTVYSYLGDGTGSFERMPATLVGWLPRSVSIAHIDSDGILDLVVANDVWGGVACFGSANSTAASRVVPELPTDAGESADRSPLTGLSVLRGKGNGTFGPERFFSTTEAGAVAQVADLNIDGRPDLVAGHRNLANMAVLLAAEDGSFGGGLDLTIGEAPVHLLLEDLNRDGFRDIAVACWESGTVAATLGDGRGVFGAPVRSPAGEHPAFLAAGDFNADGLSDLAVASFGVADTSLIIPGNGAVVVLRGDGRGSFTLSARYAPGGRVNCVRVGDLNEDGRADLVASSFSPPFVFVLLADLDGTFAEARKYPIPGYVLGAIDLGDFNDDGHLDVAIARGASGFTVIPGRGDGSLSEVEIRPDVGVFALLAIDVNRDDRLDLVVTGQDFAGQGSAASVLGNGDGTFQERATFPTAGSPFGIEAKDLNGDGFVDIATANRGSESATVYFGTGTGHFIWRTDYAVGTGATAIAAGDLNGDGRPDLGISNAGSGSISILWNRGENHIPRIAHVFLADRSRTISASPRAANTHFRLEPAAGSYSNFDVYLPSVSLESEGSGEVSRIFALTEGPSPQDDWNNNGVMELPIRFAAKDIARLFSRVQGRKVVDATLRGSLNAGGTFRADIRLSVMGATHGVQAYVAPTPSFREATLYISTSLFGRLRVRLFDSRGRLVRSLIDQPFAPAGLHSARIGLDGKSGEAIAAGLYFWKVEAADGVRAGRVLILH